MTLLPGLTIQAGTSPRGTWRCACGDTRTAHGLAPVQALAAGWHQHRDQCPGVPEHSCEHCGAPTRGRSSGTNGWPACPDCRAAWASRPAEQRRRQKAAEAIEKRAKMAFSARRTREQLERDGINPELITAILTGSIITGPDDPDIDIDDD